MTKCSCPHLCQHAVAEFKAAIKRVQKQNNTPEKAEAFLIESGIYERGKNGKLRLTKPYRD